uniref:Uncharacterized protein n=1 Tax=Suricata suricatta TaxID=37032 RepID=A0A673TG76_SURSU
MLANMIIFMVDLTLALAIFVMFYTVYLIATAGIFISALFYIVRRMNKNCDVSKGGIWLLISSSATGKPFASTMVQDRSRMHSVHFPNWKQTPGSELSAESQIRGTNS